MNFPNKLKDNIWTLLFKNIITFELKGLDYFQELIEICRRKCHLKRMLIYFYMECDEKYMVKFMDQLCMV